MKRFMQHGFDLVVVGLGLVVAACTSATSSPSAANDGGIVGDVEAGIPEGGGFGSVTKTVSYTEPASLSGPGVCSTGGAPITNLDHTTIYYQINGGPPLVGMTVPRTAPSGGGEVRRQVTIPKATSGVDTIVISVTATDTSGVESDPSCSETVTISAP